MIRMLGGLVGCQAERGSARGPAQRGLDDIRGRPRGFPRRPRVFFEEWDDPLISGIRWVEELVEIAGGEPIFPSSRRAASRKTASSIPAKSARRDPEVIFASWCGKKMKKATIHDRPGWHHVAAVRDGHILEIKSTYILQPGPAALTDGVVQIHDRLRALLS